ncbi:MAG: glycosyltransferase family 39 protein [bacterium]|nr:glycosyltransferase family 39 protein [bacterium]
MRAPALLGLLFAFVLAARLCHVDVLWIEECYPGAAAIQILHGKVPYRDFWFDKPPLSPLLYLIWGGAGGWLLRLAGALFVAGLSWLMYRFAREKWSWTEGSIAAALTAFFLTFGIPSAVMALAPDLLMMAPHVGAVYLAWRGRPFWSGVVAGIAMLVHTKGAFVLVACLLWQYRAIGPLAAGFLLPNAVALGALGWLGALRDYYEQVWQWGFVYSRDTFLTSPLAEGFRRTANWAGFHISLILASIWFLVRGADPDRRRLVLWGALSLVVVAAGWRFFPRYYFQLLPVMILAGARGFTLLGRRRAIAVSLLLLIPLLRFGPRYASLAAGGSEQWVDLAMYRGSREAARAVTNLAQPGDTLLVWGYRPDVFTMTRLPAGSRFMDSQPLTGVIADRHLSDSHPSAPELAAKNRRELTASTPTFIVDGLGPYNASLAISSYDDLAPWLASYEEIAHSESAVVYRITRGAGSQPAAASQAAPH